MYCLAWLSWHGTACSGKHRRGRESVGTIGEASAWPGKCRHDRESIGMVGKMSARSGKYRRVRENVDTIWEASAWSGKCRHDGGSIGMVGKRSARSEKHRHGRENAGTIVEASASGRLPEDGRPMSEQILKTSTPVALTYLKVFIDAISVCYTVQSHLVSSRPLYHELYVSAALHRSTLPACSICLFNTAVSS